MADKIGCIDPNALNYDPTATIPDVGGCLYKDVDNVNVWNEDSSEKVLFRLTSDPSDAQVYIGSNILNVQEYTSEDGLTPEQIQFSIFELKQPKIITVQTNKLIPEYYYRVRSERKQKLVFKRRIDIDPTITALDATAPDSTTNVTDIINFYLLTLEKWNSDEQRWDSVLIPGYRPNLAPESLDAVSLDKILDGLRLPTTIDLDFILKEVATVDPEDRLYYIDVLNQIPPNVKIQYYIDDVLAGDVTNGFNTVVYEYPTNSKITVRVDGIDEDLWEVKFIRPAQLISPNPSLPGEVKNTFFEEELVFSEQEIAIELKNTGGVDKKPVLQFHLVGGENPTAITNRFNISIPDGQLRLPFYTYNATSVTVSLPNIQRELEAEDSLILTSKDFTEGIGSYTVVFQPYRQGYGYGDSVEVVVFVEETKIESGPDITTITYPQVIEGVAFKEYDNEFQIDWQSVNTDYVEIFVPKVDTKGTKTTSTTKNSVRNISNNSTSNQFNSTGGSSLNIFNGDGVYDDTNTLEEYDEILIGKYTNNFAILNVEDIVKKAGLGTPWYRDKTSISLIIRPANTRSIDGVVYGKKERINIIFDKGDTLKRDNVVIDIKQSFLSQLDTSIFEAETTKLLSHFAHFGNGDNKIIATWGIDDETFTEYGFDASGVRVPINIVKSLVLKMYEPLPKSIEPNTTLWISKIQSLTNIEEIKIVEEVVSLCTPLKPNFYLENIAGTKFVSSENLTSTNESLTDGITNKLASENSLSLLKLNLGYSKDITKLVDDEYYEVIGEEYAWENFVKYSSAYERINNFYYKIQQIERYQNKIDEISVSSDAAASLQVSTEISRLKKNINEIKKHFDGFEWFLFEPGSSSVKYPRVSDTELKSSDSVDAIDWYNSSIDSALEFDRNNPSYLVNNIPEHIKTQYNKDYLMFFRMIGHHFDILYSYVKSATKTKKAEHVHDNGIFDDLLKSMLESLGWDVSLNTNTDNLWQYLFGLDTDTSSENKTPTRDRLNQIWRRILNNLPYIYKTKGTRRSIQALLSIYGIPSSILSIMEFAAPSLDGDIPSTFTYDEMSATVNLGGGNVIRIPWKSYSLTSDYPNSVQIRFKVDSYGNYILAQTNNTWGLGITAGTGSLGRIDFFIDSNGSSITQSTDYVPLFTDSFYTVTVNKEVDGSNENYTVYLKEGFQERIRNYTTASLSVPMGSSSWKSGSYLDIGSGSLGNFVGQIDEVRLWTTALSESKIDNHTLVPDSIAGNHISSSTEDLIFRLDFEYPKDLSTGSGILNVAINENYGEDYALAGGFDSITEYPYHYSAYDRTVTTKVYPIGFSFADKVNILDTTLDGQLSYKSRSTKQISKISTSDSDKIGVYLSPSKEINLNINKSVGDISLDQYLGDVSDDYNYSYQSLDSFRKYFFQRYNFDFNQYIQLMRGIDKNIFDIVKNLNPGRSRTQTGLLIEPHYLQRSKYQHIKPETELRNLSVEISGNSTPIVESDTLNLEVNYDVERDVLFEYDIKNFETLINTDETTYLEVGISKMETDIQPTNDIMLDFGIDRNSGSTMGGFEIDIPADIEQEIVGEYENTALVAVGGFEERDAAIGGYGYWGVGAHTILTEIDTLGQITKRRMRAYKLKIRNSVQTPYTSGSATNSEIVENYRYVITLLPIDAAATYSLVSVDFEVGSMVLNIGGTNETFGIYDIDLENGIWSLTYPSGSTVPEDTQTYQLVSVNFETAEIKFTTSIFNFGEKKNVEPEVKNEVVAVEALDGNFNNYVYDYNLPTGLERSYSYGSQQTLDTTLDGGPAVQTFTTNPNELRVNESGRGSGEPILEVE